MMLPDSFHIVDRCLIAFFGLSVILYVFLGIFLRFFAVLDYLSAYYASLPEKRDHGRDNEKRNDDNGSRTV
jgi:hypothetical protein